MQATRRFTTVGVEQLETRLVPSVVFDDIGVGHAANAHDAGPAINFELDGPHGHAYGLERVSDGASMYSNYNSNNYGNYSSGATPAGGAESAIQVSVTFTSLGQIESISLSSNSFSTSAVQQILADALKLWSSASQVDALASDSGSVGKPFSAIGVAPTDATTSSDVRTVAHIVEGSTKIAATTFLAPSSSNAANSAFLGSSENRDGQRFASTQTNSTGTSGSGHHLSSVFDDAVISSSIVGPVVETSRLATPLSARNLLTALTFGQATPFSTANYPVSVPDTNIIDFDLGYASAASNPAETIGSSDNSTPPPAERTPPANSQPAPEQAPQMQEQQGQDQSEKSMAGVVGVVMGLALPCSRSRKRKKAQRRWLPRIA